MAAGFKLKSGPVQKLTGSTPWDKAAGTQWEPHTITAPAAKACSWVGKRILDGATYGVFTNKKGEHFARPMSEVMK